MAALPQASTRSLGHGGAHGPSPIADHRFRFAFDNAAIGMALASLEGRFRQVNPKLCELVGRSVEELLDSSWQAITHPDDVDRGVGQLESAVEHHHRSFTIEKRYVHREGHVVWVLVTVSLVRSDRSDAPPYLFTQVVDITEQKEAQAATRHLAAIVESTDEAILSVGLDGVISAWNPAAERMLGYRAHEAVGQPLSTIVPTGHRAAIERILEEAHQGTGSPYHETYLQPQAGPPVAVAAAVSPIVGDLGAPVGTSIVARDINEHRRLATELDVTLQALASALADANEAEARSRRFLADAAHQLRTPLAGVRACAETLLRAPQSPQAAALLADLVREASRASRLMTSLIRMSRLDQREPLMPTACDLADVCAAELDRAQGRAPHLRMTLSTEGLSRSSHVLGVASVQEMLANLLENAARHARTAVDVTLRDEVGTVVLAVADDGDGVPEEIRDRIFERFGTFDGLGGSGLGLPIAREIAHAHGGRLTYEPAENTFVATLGVDGGHESHGDQHTAPPDGRPHT